MVYDLMTSQYEQLKQKIGIDTNFDQEVTDRKSIEAFQVLYPGSTRTLQDAINQGSERSSFRCNRNLKSSGSNRYTNYEKLQQKYFQKLMVKKGFNPNEFK